MDGEFAQEFAQLPGRSKASFWNRYLLCPTRGHKGAGVLEVIEDHAGDTYRCMYTVRYVDKVYVLHAFQKKSKKGIATPQADIDVINRRLIDVKKLEGVKSWQSQKILRKAAAMFLPTLV